MTTSTSLRLETEQQAVYDLSISSPNVSHSVSFSVTSDGALGFDNRQPGARFCAGRRLSLALAGEMMRIARERTPGSLLGRTQRGLAFELRVHYRLYRLGLFRRRTVTTEMGSPFSDKPDYDHNAAWFEHPIRSVPSILKALFSGNR